jgi:tRNA-dihydrouridine synthase
MIGRGAVRNPYIFRQLNGGPAPTAEELRYYFTVLTEETNRILHTKRTPAGHCNRMKKYLAFCYDYFTPEQEHALRRCTNIDDMQRIFDQLQTVEA